MIKIELLNKIGIQENTNFNGIHDEKSEIVNEFLNFMFGRNKNGTNLKRLEAEAIIFNLKPSEVFTIGDIEKDIYLAEIEKIDEKNIKVKESKLNDMEIFK